MQLYRFIYGGYVIVLIIFTAKFAKKITIHIWVSERRLLSGAEVSRTARFYISQKKCTFAF